MAHLIDFQTGSAAFVTLKAAAWHGLGTVVDSEMTLPEAIKLAHLDFQVAKLPNIHRIPTGIHPETGLVTFKEIESPTSFFTYRTDTNFVLGDRLGNIYEVVQNEDALAVVEALRSEGLVIETAGSIRNGCVVFMCCRLPEDMIVAGNDRVKRYLLICAGHDGGTAILAFFTDTRVVCNNTLQVAMQGAKQKHAILHTKTAGEKLDEALKLMGFAVKNHRVATETFNRMAERKVSRQQFFDYVGNIFCSDAEIKALQAGKQAAEVLSTRKANIIADVLSFADNGIGQREAGPGSMWWGYNAVTGYFSHNKKFESPDTRMESLLWGSAAGQMTKALALAAEPAGIQPLRQVAAQAFNLN